jgi:phage terminase Nu1 subunit (DNA packaging protein)
MLTLFKVYDGNSFIGWYRAKNAKIAMGRAVRDQAQTASVFRKSCPAVKLKNLRAEAAPATQQG